MEILHAPIYVHMLIYIYACTRPQSIPRFSHMKSCNIFVINIGSAAWPLLFLVWYGFSMPGFYNLHYELPSTLRIVGLCRMDRLFLVMSMLWSCSRLNAGSKSFGFARNIGSSRAMAPTILEASRALGRGAKAIRPSRDY